jgi:hypothetical protein
MYLCVGSKITLKLSYLVLHCLSSARGHINVLSYDYKFHVTYSFQLILNYTWIIS